MGNHDYIVYDTEISKKKSLNSGSSQVVLHSRGSFQIIRWKCRC